MSVYCEFSFVYSVKYCSSTYQQISFQIFTIKGYVGVFMVLRQLMELLLLRLWR
jgi:hypothetical protein